MTAQLLSFFTQTSALVVQVSKVDELGRVIQVSLNQGQHTEVAVIGQLDSVSACQVNDPVIVWHTNAGCVVMGKLLTANEAPAVLPRDVQGQVLLNASKAISLSCGKSQIELLADGSLRLEGTEIDAQSERDFNLIGWPIRLN
ncbi:hypothetical protein ACFOEE_06430 [Pseudoalteromonas fenneropenaei]|uniref:Uncharacterized protein n=1 Tax=Pseudoalteromonas fenneropenaei TaxID=1737459 RepID=A0ABV7CHS7_9GAMM